LKFEKIILIRKMKLSELVSLLKKGAMENFDLYSLSILEKFREKLADRYYNTDKPLVKDLYYDKFISYLQERNLEEKKEDYVPPVGAKLREGENRVKLPFKLLSCDKITDDLQLKIWLKKNKDNSYVITEKLDGVSCLAILKENKGAFEWNLFSRGDGEIGADLNHIRPFLKLPPAKDLRCQFAVRGELILKKKTFEKKYRGKEINSRVYKNSRNMVTGLVGSKTRREGLEDINFIVYEIIPFGQETACCQEEQLKTLQDLGFKVPRNEVIEKISIDVLKEKLLDYKENSKYEIDGIIIQKNSEYVRSSKRNPSYNFAFKMLVEEDIHETKVISVEWNISKNRLLKPTVIFEPVELDDIKMERATGHNAGYILENKIGKDTIIKVCRSNGVIPYILEVVSPSSCMDSVFPEMEYTWDKNKVNIIANENQDEETPEILKISDFFTKIGVKFVSEKTIKHMFEAGLDSLKKISSASVKDLSKVERMGEKSAIRIVENIKKGLENLTLAQFLGHSSIFGPDLGYKRISSVLKKYPNLLTEKITKEKLIEVEGISEILAEKILNNLNNAKKFVKEFEGIITFKEKKGKETEKKNDMIQGKKIVFSGFRNKEWEALIEDLGGKVVGAVSSKVNILVVKDKEETSSKINKARELEIEILDLEEFEKILEIN